MKIKRLQVNRSNLRFLYGESYVLNWIYDEEVQHCFQVDIVINKKQKYSEHLETDANYFRIPIEIKEFDQVEILLTINNKDSRALSFEVPIYPESITAEWINGEDIEAYQVFPDRTEGEVEIGRDAFKSKFGELAPKRNAVIYKKDFVIEEIRDPRLYITCHGIYKVKINDKIIDSILEPGPAEYDIRIPYQTYNLSNYLRLGKNVIEVTVVSGWYRGRMYNSGLINNFGNDNSLLLEIHSGTQIIKTDETWVASTDNGIYLSDLMDGEIVDARIKPRNFRPVKIEKFPKNILFPDDQEETIEAEVFEPQLIITPNGEKVLDFGQNIAGYIKISVEAKGGEHILLTCGETLDENGNFTQKNFNTNKTIRQQISYICKEGKNDYKPIGSIFGFRYAKLEGDIACPSAFKAVAVYTNIENVGEFACGNDKINRLFQNAVWSQKGNFLGIPTDCPTRERCGFTGDIQVYIHTALYLSDCYSFIRKWLRELVSTQYDDGCLKGIAPDPSKRTMFDGSSGWLNAMVIVPDKIEKYYGDCELYQEFYDAMKKTVLFQLNRAKSKTRSHNLNNPLHEYLYDNYVHWGEWMEPNTSPVKTLSEIIMNGDPEICTTYLCNDLRIMAEVSKKLGKEEDHSFFKEAAEKTLKAYQFTCLDEGKVKNEERMCRYVRPLHYEMLSEEGKRDAARRLHELVVKNGYHLNSGFLTTHILLRTLAENGYVETAYRLLTQETYPSWLYAVNKGLTTIPETWEAIDENGVPHESLNHYAYGSVVGFLFDTAAGIKIENGKIVIAPKPDRSLKFLRAKTLSPFGTIEVAWTYEGEKISYRITVPYNAVVTIILPDGREFEVHGGEYNY